MGLKVRGTNILLPTPLPLPPLPTTVLRGNIYGLQSGIFRIKI